MEKSSIGQNLTLLSVVLSLLSNGRARLDFRHEYQDSCPSIHPYMTHSQCVHVHTNVILLEFGIAQTPSPGYYVVLVMG